MKLKNRSARGGDAAKADKLHRFASPADKYLSTWRVFAVMSVFARQGIRGMVVVKMKLFFFSDKRRMRSRWPLYVTAVVCAGGEDTGHRFFCCEMRRIRRKKK
jgi:hypothetical protein